MKTVTKPATKRQARAALSAIAKRYDYAVGGTYGPWLSEDEDGCPVIVWEGGPFDWDVEVSLNMPDAYPAGVWLEPINCWSIRVFRNVVPAQDDI